MLCLYHIVPCKATHLYTYLFFSADICRNYQTLSDAERKRDFATVYPPQCDDKLNDWYRFEGDAGKQMATTCPPANRCDADIPGWLNGAHPTVAEGEVKRKVCFHQAEDCCKKERSIQVKNCGSYYIYRITGTPACKLRYCGE